MVVLLSWNVHCVPVPGGCSASHVEKVASYAAKLASQHDASVIVLNEIFVERMRTAILKRLRHSGRTWNMTPIANASNVAPLVGSGVVVAWRDDIQKHGKMHEMTYKSCCQFDCLSHKGGLHVPLRAGKRVFHIIATHMQALELPLVCNGVRDRQSANLGRMVDRLEKRGVIGSLEPVLFAGDFNEAFSHGMESRLRATHVRCESGCKTHDMGEFDHFYARRRQHADFAATPFRSVSVSGAKNPSDHSPILVKLM